MGNRGIGCDIKSKSLFVFFINASEECKIFGFWQLNVEKESLR